VSRDRPPSAPQHQPVAARFADLDLPDTFVLEVPDGDGQWITHGLYAADLFARLPDGSYLCAGHGSSPLYLRCVSRHGNELEVLDGAGKPWRCRLVELPESSGTGA
jgi:hypothetical protein